MASLIEDLVAAGACTAELADRVVREVAGAGGGRVTDSLVAQGLADERKVLRLLALRAGTRFVTVEKLRTARVEQEVLDRVPVRFAEAHSALPLKHDPATGTLLIAAADPAGASFLVDLKIVSGLENVVALVALEFGIKAAIRRFYYGDVTAFETLAREITPLQPPQLARDTQEVSLSKIFRVPPKG